MLSPVARANFRHAVSVFVLDIQRHVLNFLPLF
jgi:hypothetical protein